MGLAAWLLLVAASHGWLFPSAPPPPWALLDCRTAISVDGALLCGAEARGVVQRCPSGAVAPGAVLERSAPCAPRGVLPADDIAALQMPLDVNTAPPELLDSLPGVGPVTAERMVEARPYVEPRDLLEVRGIGEKRLAGMQARVRFEPVSPGDTLGGI